MPTISLALGERSYDIHVENGALDRTGEFAYRAGLDGKIAVITDSCVAPLYAERVMKSLESAGFMPSLHVVNAGEASKNMLQAQELCSELGRAGLDRTGCIAALGGGVVGDLAGFIASIYYRGIPFMQIPTTVVAQVDSSVGGKTAVNIPEGKNLVGAFHQPSVVVIDPTTLVTLDRRTLAEGLAEAVKHAAIKDASMLHELKGLGPELSIGFSLNTIARLPDLISRNVAIKARIVENDELETLDIHTIGHGIEAAVPYGTILHGEAVALGMRAALFLSERKAGLSSSDANKILRTLQALELPLVLPDGIDTATVLQKRHQTKSSGPEPSALFCFPKQGRQAFLRKLLGKIWRKPLKNCAAPWIEFTTRGPLFSSKKTPGVGLYRYFPLLFAHFPIRKRKGFTGGPDTISNRPSFRQNGMKRNIVVITQFPTRGIYFYGSSAVGSNPSTSRGTLPVYSPASK